VTFAQLMVAFFVASALNTVTLSLSVAQSPRGSRTRRARLFTTLCLALASALLGASAAIVSRTESAPPHPAYAYQVPACAIPFGIALLLLSAFMLGYAIVKGPRNPQPTA
jgi:hypothetical protein